MPSDLVDEAARNPDECSPPFCTAAPEVEFEDEWGVTVRWCRECFDRTCGRCFGEIRDAYKRKGLCQSCRDEIRMWGGDEERGIEKEPDSEQTTLLT